MGCVDTISYDKFPKQSDNDYKYPQLGKRVKVCYHYDTSKFHYGVIVRDDNEEPFRTIIALDNGIYVLGSECQYSFADEPSNDNESKPTEDGCYIEFFALKDGTRYNAKIVCLKDMIRALTNGIMDSFEQQWQ
jgi:hypothetical protein